jgi:hypothetical protein
MEDLLCKRVSLEEIAENKIILRKLSPHAQSLRYIYICSIGKDGLIAYFNFQGKDPSLEDFEKYSGIAIQDRPSSHKILGAYNRALKKQIKSINFQKINRHNSYKS